jgi:L-alanine-DL-glutamate epimerase-like enolase superfamily enzyme
MQLKVRTIQLPLRHVFRTAHGADVVLENVLVELRDGDLTGYGEGASMQYYGVTAADMVADLEAARGAIESWPGPGVPGAPDPAELWQRVLPLLGHDRFALAALDAAAHDLWGKKLGRPTYRLWGLELDRIPPSNYTLGIDSLENTLKILDEFAGWPIYKIKLGTPDDLKIVGELRRHTTATFRVDANCAWTVEQTILNSRALKTLGVEFIEQPLPADDWEGMKRVFAASALPVMADESCLVEEDVARCPGFFHGVNIKLVKCGGMTPARRMIDTARRLGLKVMIGCMTESTVGISAIAQFLPLLDYVDMDGAVLIARDVASGVRLEKGRAVFPDENGNGVRLLDETT